MHPARGVISSSRVRVFGLIVVVAIAAAVVQPGVARLGPERAEGVGAATAVGRVTDAWSSPTVFRTSDGWYAAPVHGTLLPDGRVLFSGYARPTNPAAAPSPVRGVTWIFTPPPVGTVPPAEITIRQIAEPVIYSHYVTGNYTVDDVLVCAGNALTADGKVLIAGGTRTYTNTVTGVQNVTGLPTEMLFDPKTDTLARLPGAMIGTALQTPPTRWYPTVTRLPSGKMLVTSGFDYVEPTGTVNLTTETYDPATGARAVTSPYGTMPLTVWNEDYTHAWVEPWATSKWDLLTLGETGYVSATSTASLNTWWIYPQRRPNAAGAKNSGWGQSSVLLPLRAKNGDEGYNNGSFLVAGGAHNTPLMNQIDVFDPVASVWKPTVDGVVMRHHPSTLPLPDGRILVVAGHNLQNTPDLRLAEYVDPEHGFAVSMGTADMGVTRGYHSVSLLLPDGRVLVAGGRDFDTNTSLEKASVQYYSPDYTARPRPRITAALATLGYGAWFPMKTDGPAPVDVELIALGSMTHSFDENTRMVQLRVASVTAQPDGSSVVVAASPADSHVAPPGYYMMFAVDANRVPSAATMVRIG